MRNQFRQSVSRHFALFTLTLWSSILVLQTSALAQDVARNICNSNGYVLSDIAGAAGGANSGNSKLYLGVSCDAFSDRLGQGAWCWGNGGVLAEFNGTVQPVGIRELPTCPQHSNPTACGCGTNPLPSEVASSSPTAETQTLAQTSRAGAQEPAATLPAPAAAVPEVPVLERAADGDLPTCATSVVSVTNSRLAIRSGPGSQYQVLDTLSDGEVVIVFEERGDWAGVVYRTNDVTCASQTTRKVPYQRSGWVDKNLLRDLAG